MCTAADVARKRHRASSAASSASPKATPISRFRLNPNSLGMTVVLGMMTAMGPISTDFYIPALPQLVTDLGTTPARVQWTMSAYLIGFALAQILYGPLSDKYGRKPVLMGAFAIYLLACFVSAFAHSIETLTAARFVQGMGGAGPIIVARAIVRDMYSGSRAGQQLATMSSIMGLAPILSPMIGGVLAVQFGWRAAFVAMFTVIATLMAITALFLPETIKHRMVEKFSLGAILRSFAIIIRNPVWAVYAVLAGAGQTGVFTFMSASPFVLQGIYGLTPMQFGLGLSTCSIAFVVGAYVSLRLVRRKGLDTAIGYGVLLLALGGIMQALGVKFFPSHPAALFVSELVFFGGVGITMPHAIAGLLSPFPERAGAATSLAGFFQFSFSAAFGLYVVAAIGSSATDATQGYAGATAMPLALATMGLGVGAAIVFFATIKVRARHAAVRSGAIR